MHEMTADEMRAFLLGTPRTGKLATVREDGRPHIAPVWFDWDGDALIFTTWHESVKAKNIRRDPRVSLCVDDEQPPFAFVLVDGVARVDENAADLYDWAARIAGRYMGLEQAEAFGRRNSVAGEWLVRVQPAKVVARKGISDW